MPDRPIIHTAIDGRGRQILTVAQLRHALDEVDPNTHVLVAKDDGGWWSNIAEVVLPDGDTVVAVTLIPGSKPTPTTPSPPTPTDQGANLR